MGPNYWNYQGLSDFIFPSEAGAYRSMEKDEFIEPSGEGVFYYPYSPRQERDEDCGINLDLAPEYFAQGMGWE